MAKTTTTKSTPKTVKESPSAFSVVMTGGKQYIVRVGDVLTVEKLDGEYTAGQEISFDQVLMTTDGTKTSVGTPTVSGAIVTATFVEGGLGKKITVIRYKAKSRYYKKRGHRQPFMKFKITKIA